MRGEEENNYASHCISLCTYSWITKEKKKKRAEASQTDRQTREERGETELEQPDYKLLQYSTSTACRQNRQTDRQTRHDRPTLAAAALTALVTRYVDTLEYAAPAGKAYGNPSCGSIQYWPSRRSSRCLDPDSRWIGWGCGVCRTYSEWCMV